jgi:sugar lactone lactonase YvrE
MRRHSVLALLLLSGALSGCAVKPAHAPDRVADAAAAASVQTIASYPSGTFLENLDVGPDGAVLVTSYLDRSLLSWSGVGPPRVVATLPAHPVGVLSRAGDVIVSAHGAPFTRGPAFTGTNMMLVLDRSGRVIRRTAAPDALFLNGLVELSPDIILAADSLAGRIWAYDPGRGAIVSWFADPLLAVDPAQTAQRPGANGLKIVGDQLYISNTSRGAIYRLRVADGRPAGPLQTFASTGPVDDFAPLPDGSIAAATHGRKLIHVATDGAVSDIMAEGCDGCTSVAALGSGDLVVLTTGDLLEGGAKPARMLRVTSPVGR